MKMWKAFFSENGEEYEGWIKIEGESVYIDDADKDILHVDGAIIQIDEYWLLVEEILE